MGAGVIGLTMNLSAFFVLIINVPAISFGGFFFGLGIWTCAMIVIILVIFPDKDYLPGDKFRLDFHCCSSRCAGEQQQQPRSVGGESGTPHTSALKAFCTDTFLAMRRNATNARYWAWTLGFAWLNCWFNMYPDISSQAALAVFDALGEPADYDFFASYGNTLLEDAMPVVLGPLFLSIMQCSKRLSIFMLLAILCCQLCAFVIWVGDETYTVYLGVIFMVIMNSIIYSMQFVFLQTFPQEDFGGLLTTQLLTMGLVNYVGAYGLTPNPFAPALWPICLIILAVATPFYVSSLLQYRWEQKQKESNM